MARAIGNTGGLEARAALRQAVRAYDILQEIARTGTFR